MFIHLFMASITTALLHSLHGTAHTQSAQRYGQIKCAVYIFRNRLCNTALPIDARTKSITFSIRIIGLARCCSLFVWPRSPIDRAEFHRTQKKKWSEIISIKKLHPKAQFNEDSFSTDGMQFNSWNGKFPSGFECLRIDQISFAACPSFACLCSVCCCMCRAKCLS